MASLLVTGGAGFIGANFVHLVRAQRPDTEVVVLDKLTYAGNRAHLDGLDRVTFVQGDVADPDDVRRAFEAAGKGARVVHFAAESHVDRSIDSCAEFLSTNVVGTQVMLDVARGYDVERFLHVSTDEVYGSLPDGAFADEQAKLNPTNPYSASKAASDHLVLAAVNTHGIPAVITRCSNNYGRFQFPEKFVPVMITRAMQGKPLPIYGDGLYVRDWIHVDDHGEAILAVLECGETGTVYNVAGDNHRTNLDVARLILAAVGAAPDAMEHVQDRPGHDRRYAPDDARIRDQLGWKPTRDFESELAATVRWYGERYA
ncbi:MAG: dTDP-glucose 4,6-dehydratase [Planctomycetota bacterium]